MSEGISISDPANLGEGMVRQPVRLALLIGALAIMAAPAWANHGSSSCCSSPAPAASSCCNGSNGSTAGACARTVMVTECVPEQYTVKRTAYKTECRTEEY